MMFTMSHLLEAQREFQRIYIKKLYGKDLEELTQDERGEIIKQQVLSLLDETHEFLNKATNWKNHRAVSTIDRHAALEEHVDIGKYWLNIFIYMEISPHEFMRIFSEKSQVVRERWSKEFGDG